MRPVILMNQPPAIQSPVNCVGKTPWSGDLYHAGESMHTFEGLCNEPDMETPWTYAYAGRLDRLAEVVTATKTYSFSPGRGGICGNIDSGGEAGKASVDALSRHLLFALGFYPYLLSRSCTVAFFGRFPQP
eukprot:COSAG02_NODE_7476_length_2995_cov_1.921271_4_plen_131_part_00